MNSEGVTQNAYGTFFFTEPLGEFAYSKKFSKPFIAALCLIFGLVVFLNISRSSPRTSEITTVKLADSRHSDEDTTVWHYGVMLDLGSDGSRVFVYRWQPFFPLRSIVQLGSYSTQPGVSFYATHGEGKVGDVPQRVAISLLNLLDFARSLVPPMLRSSCSIHAKCTAGCRLLNATQLSQTIHGVREALSASGFSFQPEWAQAISGEEEALLDWVSINGALGLLHQPVLNEMVFTFSPTVGVMDIGGASAQIAYSVLPVMTSAAPATGAKLMYGNPLKTTTRPVVFSYGHGIYHMRLVNGVEHTIYAISRLHYGMNQAFFLVISHDIDSIAVPRRKNSSAMQFAHPCVFRETFLVTQGGRMVRGGGDATQCHNVVKKFFIEADQNDLGNISWAGPPPPLKHSYMPFVGMNNFDRLHTLATMAKNFHVKDEVTYAEGELKAFAVPETTPSQAGSTAAEGEEPSEISLLQAHHRSKAGQKDDDKNAHKKRRSKSQPQEDHSSAPFSVNSLRDCMRNFHQSTPSVYLQAARVICAMKWSDIQLYFQSAMTVDRLRYSCFGLVFMDVLLHEVYTFAQQEAFYAMKTTYRCPNLRLPNVDTKQQLQQQQGSSGGTQQAVKLHSNQYATYDSTWALGGMILEMEETEVSGLEYNISISNGF